MNTVVSSMNQHRSHTNILDVTMTAFENKLDAGPCKACIQKPHKTKTKEALRAW